MKHTRGPWSNGKDIPITAKSCDDAGFSLVYVNLDTREEPNANARLIAAAPDLLKELTNLLLWAEEVHKKGPHASLNYTGMDNARVAIKKATGVWHE